MNEITAAHEAQERDDKGFTLVELLIVIVILGILAAVTVFAVAGITGTASENTCAAEYSTVQTAIDAYTVEEGAPPATLAALVAADYIRDTPSNLNDVGEDDAHYDGNGNLTRPDDCGGS